MTPGSGALRLDCVEADNSKEGKRLWFWWRWRSATNRLDAFAWRSFRTSRQQPCFLFLKKHVALGATIYTDGLKSFTGLKEAGFQHVARSQPRPTNLRKGAKSVVPLADNLQQWLLGTHHGVSRDQLQVYLDEFVFRHNRRKQPMAAFQTLLGFGAARQPTEYKQIRGAADISGKTAPSATPQPIGPS